MAIPVPHAVGHIERNAFFLSTRERVRDKARYLFHHLREVNERDRAVLPLPAFLYYLLRPIRLLARHGNPWRFRKRLLGF